MIQDESYGYYKYASEIPFTVLLYTGYVIRESALQTWCQQRAMELNATKTKELTTSFNPDFLS